MFFLFHREVSEHFCSLAHGAPRRCWWGTAAEAGLAFRARSLSQSKWFLGILIKFWFFYICFHFHAQRFLNIFRRSGPRCAPPLLLQQAWPLERAPSRKWAYSKISMSRPWPFPWHWLWGKIVYVVYYILVSSMYIYVVKISKDL